MTGSGEGKPGEFHPARIARELGIPVRGGFVSEYDVIDAAVRCYWDRRRDPTCGSYPGYLMHLRQDSRPCAPCKKARAAVAAIQRRRRAAA